MIYIFFYSSESKQCKNVPGLGMGDTVGHDSDTEQLESEQVVELVSLTLVNVQYPFTSIVWPQ